MTGRVAIALTGVAPRPDDHAVRVHDERTHGDVAVRGGLTGQLEGPVHPRLLDGALRTGGLGTHGDSLPHGSFGTMRVIVADHPLIAHKLTYLRHKGTDSPTFRRLADELVTLLAYEATREVRTEPFDIETPVSATTGIKLSTPKPLVVPILRAGLGMLEGMVRLLPTAEVGFLGMLRNEETLEAVTYANRLPDDLSGRQCYVIDPMLATGGTLAMSVRYLVDRGADDITAVTLLAAPEGIEAVERELADLDVPVTLVTGAIDERLNEQGYIVPGLGDAGDRLYGVV